MNDDELAAIELLIANGSAGPCTSQQLLDEVRRLRARNKALEEATDYVLRSFGDEYEGRLEPLRILMPEGA
jgi:hypothetical protein